MSDDKVRDYVSTSLNANGMVILDSAIAFESGGWHSRGNCNTDFRDIDGLVMKYGANCEKCMVKTGDRQVVLLYRSLSRLAERVEEIYGIYIADDLDYVPEVREEKKFNVGIDRVTEKAAVAERQARDTVLRAKLQAEKHQQQKEHQQWKNEQMLLARKSRKEFYERIN